jgi:DNA-binding MarR family transcriptional regulator
MLTPQVLYEKEDSIGFLISRTAKAFTWLLEHRMSANGFDIRVEHWSVLYHVFRERNLLQQELTSLTCMDKTAVTRSVDHLVKLGYINRTEDSTDRRKQRITLTDHGASLQQQLVHIVWNEVKEEACSSMTPEQTETLKNLLNLLYHRILPLQQKRTSPEEE